MNKHAPTETFDESDEIDANMDMVLMLEAEAQSVRDDVTRMEARLKDMLRSAKEDRERLTRCRKALAHLERAAAEREATVDKLRDMLSARRRLLLELEEGQR